jgi:hypothetical protein
VITNTTVNNQPWFRLHVSDGELLADGTALELVLADSRDRLHLLHFDGEKGSISPQIELGGVIYCPPRVHSSVLTAVRFPSGVAEYGERTELFCKVTGLFRHYIGVSPEAAAYLAYIVICSWFPECDPGPVTLCITGTDVRQVLRLFRLLHALCRRPLVAAELTRRLPFFLHPTLMLNISWISAKTGGFWRALNFPGVYVADAGGAVSNIACAKIIFCEEAEFRETWGPEAKHFSLLPVTGELPFLTPREADALADEYQRQFLMLRLRLLVPRQQAGGDSDVSSPDPIGSAVRWHLPLFLQGEPEIVKALTPLLEAHEQERLARHFLDPHVAIVEAVWAAAHAGKEISVAEVAKRVNALLRNRGEILEFSAKQIGWKLKSLGLQRHDNGNNKVLRFCRETRRQIHKLAAQFGLKLPKMENCADCEDSQLAVQQ